MKIGPGGLPYIGQDAGDAGIAGGGLDELCADDSSGRPGSSNPTIARWHGLLPLLDHPLSRCRIF
jgi:hypothetical protein